MNTNPCNGRVDADAVHRYVAGTLPADATQEFEIHLLSCGACRAAVHEGTAVRAALLGMPRPRAAAAAGWVRRGPARAARWLSPLVAAAVVLALLVAREDPIRALGAIGDLPAYQPLPVRAAALPFDQHADSGMAAYAAGDLAKARVHLEEAARERPSPGVTFFLGVARLATNDAAGAIEALNDIARPGGNAYASEARLYLAKAWLRSGNADSALGHLAAVPGGAVVHSHAAALADSIRAAIRR